MDVYINIVGGLDLNETACDLAVCLAMASALMDKPIGDKTIAIGEVGLAGEIRNVTFLETGCGKRSSAKAIVPKHSLKQLKQRIFKIWS